MDVATTPWPSTPAALVALQAELARRAEEAVTADPWAPFAGMLVGGCYVAFARGEAGPGHPGDRAWAGAVSWLPGVERRRGDLHLRGAPSGAPRRADDVRAQAVVADRVGAAYAAGLLALREGPILAAAVGGLAPPPDVLLVDATGTDHPRRAGVAVHLGAVTGIPTIGVTHRPLVATGDPPELRRGARAPLRLDGRVVGYWICTRTGARAVAAHAGWRTTPDTAADTVLAASTEGARTPVPLQEARRVAREARALAGAG